MLHIQTTSFPLSVQDGGTTLGGMGGSGPPLRGQCLTLGGMGGSGPPLRDQCLTLSALSLSLSAAEALASRTPSRQPDPQGQGWAGGTPASSRSPPATSPRPGWGCWAPRGCWAPPSAAPPPAPPSSSKADRLVGVRGISSSSIPFPQAFFAFPSVTCPDPHFFPHSSSGLQALGCAPPCAVGCGSGASGRGTNQVAEGEKLSP